MMHKLQRTRCFSTSNKAIFYPVTILGGGPVGLFLSRLLREYEISHCLVERREQPRTHPQAHYLNMRTMEVLRTWYPDAFIESVKQTPPSSFWRDFVYCHTVAGTEYARQNHFLDVDNDTWMKSPTTVLHLAQNRFEKILRLHHPSEDPFTKSYFGFTGDLQSYDHDSCTVKVKSINTPKEFIVRSKFVVSCEGTSSSTRNQLHIQYEGKEKLQHLMNIHFKCKRLKEVIKKRPGMLYFVFNQKAIMVIVVHDVVNDEYVCQLPYFPPYESPSDYSPSKVLDLLTYSLFGNNDKENEKSIDLLDISHWIMNAQVARSFVDEKHHRVFLAGDAAHRFPPSGGFGMNTGIQDAHNLAWKLAYLVKKEGDELSRKNLAKSYDTERRKINWDNTNFSLKNYDNTAQTAAALGVDPKYADIALATVNNSVSNKLLPFFLQKQLFLKSLQTGLIPLSLLEKPKSNPYGQYRVQAIQKIVQEKRSLGLIFPKEDLDFSYPIHRRQGPDNQWSVFIGRRLPHYWLFAVNEDRNGSVPVSTTDLPQLIWNALKANQATKVPLYILLVAEDKLEERIIQDLQNDKEREVVIVKVVKSLDQRILHEFLPSSSKEGGEVTHSTLQSALQIPHLRLQENYGDSYNFQRALNEKKDEIKGLSQSWWTPVVSSLDGKSFPLQVKKGQDFLTIELSDVIPDSNKLNPHHTKPSNPRDIGLYHDLLVSKEICGILIRPDGHIDNIYSR